MKLLSVILTLLVISMGAAPCPEEPDPNGKDQLSVVSHEKQDKPDGVCNAWCHCGSCPFSILPSESYEGPAAEPIPARFSMTAIERVMNVSFTIWQPPRTQAA